MIFIELITPTGEVLGFLEAPRERWKARKWAMVASQSGPGIIRVSGAPRTAKEYFYKGFEYSSLAKATEAISLRTKESQSCES